MALIDAHLHQWDPAAVDYPWLASAPARLQRSYTVDQEEQAIDAAGITHAILVQAADSAADNAAMLAAASAHPWIAGVVAWAPLDRPKQLAAALAQFTQQPLIKGVRLLIHDYADTGFILSDAVAPGLAALAAAGLAFDFVTSSPAALAQVPTLAAAHPELTIVIDHLGKPPIGGTADERDSWAQLLTAAAKHPNVVAKASGLYGGSEPAKWTRGEVRRALDTAAACLGPERLMLGSDWPVCEIAGGRERVWGALIAETAMWAPREREAIRWQTAARTYGIEPGRTDNERKERS